MATDDTVQGVLARLLLDKQNSQDEYSTPHLKDLWMEHLTDADDRDIIAACRAVLEDSTIRFLPTIAEFLDEVQIQSRDRIRRSIPPDVEPQQCMYCAGMGFVFIESPTPWTVRPCECSERQYELWKTKHYNPGHVCPDCSAPLARNRKPDPGGRRVPARIDTTAAEARFKDA